MLLTIVVYIYTVIAFNFFRKFYVSEEEEEVDQKCHDMLTVSSKCCRCCQFHTNASFQFFCQWKKILSRLFEKESIVHKYSVGKIINRERNDVN